MPDARDRIVATLSDEFGYYSPSHRNRVADLLMVIVQDAVAEGFKTAADILERPLPDGATPAFLLRAWALDAEDDSPKPAEDPTGPWVSGASVHMPPED